MSNANVLNVYPGAGMVLLIGMVVVFAVLILLTFVFWLFGKIMSNKEASPSPTVIKPTNVSRTPVADDIPDEVVAVIAAAVAAMSDGTTRYTIRRIRPAAAANARSAWAAAGLLDNTRPF